MITFHRHYNNRLYFACFRFESTVWVHLGLFSVVIEFDRERIKQEQQEQEFPVYYDAQGNEHQEF